MVPARRKAAASCHPFPPDARPMKRHFLHPSGLHIAIEGPGPFATRLSFTRAGRHIVWLARQHRKGLDLRRRALDPAGRPFWQSAAYNWSVGAIFAVGSFLFMLGSVLSLVPASAWAWPALWTNIVFFAGSIPFTIAGYLQHFQAANARDFMVDPPAGQERRVALIGWHPASAGWLSTFTQFLGTVAFNFNTFDAILAPPSATAQDLFIWTPDMIGSALFLISGYLAFIETSHRYWSWKPKDLAWQIVFVNLLGCIAFMIAAILAFVPAGPEPSWIPAVSNINLLLGALGFFVGALLTMRESRAAS